MKFIPWHGNFGHLIHPTVYFYNKAPVDQYTLTVDLLIFTSVYFNGVYRVKFYEI